MAKVGRNAPCPCGSGRKYKHCCGASPSGPAVASPTLEEPRSILSARRAHERTLADIAGTLSGEQLSTPTAGAPLQPTLFDDPLPQAPPPRALDRAQDLIYDAWESRSGSERAGLARRALKIHSDCADAYVILAEETSRTVQDALKLYAQGVAAGERALGPGAFDEWAGHFWGLLETRPYMRARAGLGQCLWDLGKRQEAIDHYQDMLRLNPGDNQGVRYLVLGWLLEVGHPDQTRALLDRYKGDIAASWAYGRALWALRVRGDTAATRALLAKAHQANPHAPAYLLGQKPLPTPLPELIGIGDEREGVEVAVEQGAAWRKTPGALGWLARSLETEGPRPAKDGPAPPAEVRRERATPPPTDLTSKRATPPPTDVGSERATPPPTDLTSKRATPPPTALTSKRATPPPTDLRSKRATPPPTEVRSERATVPLQLRPTFDALIGLIEAACRQRLTDEYAQVCRRLAAALCRKRPSPVTRGRLESWACGIVYVIGSTNFLFDKSQNPHLTAGELCALFGVSLSTGAAKATEIRKMFRIGIFDPEWCLPSLLDENPLVWLITVDGLIIDARHAPRTVQEEAFRLGLIPYLPDTSSEDW